MRPIEDPAVISDIANWIKYVSETKTSNNWAVCPYAHKAKMDQQVKIFRYNFIQLDQIVNEFTADGQTFKVWVFICDPKFDVEAEAKTLNNWFHDVVWLWDIADQSGDIDGTLTGNGKHNLLLLQDRNELVRMSETIRERGYYSNWSESYYDQIVSWRKNDH
jgi:hypothetical protein